MWPSTLVFLFPLWVQTSAVQMVGTDGSEQVVRQKKSPLVLMERPHSIVELVPPKPQMARRPPPTVTAEPLGQTLHLPRQSDEFDTVSIYWLTGVGMIATFVLGGLLSFAVTGPWTPKLMGKGQKEEWLLPMDAERTENNWQASKLSQEFERIRRRELETIRESQHRHAQDAAILRLQSFARGSLARRFVLRRRRDIEFVGQLQRTKSESERHMEASAVRIQAALRGRRIRRKIALRRLIEETEERERLLTTSSSSTTPEYFDCENSLSWPNLLKDDDPKHCITLAPTKRRRSVTFDLTDPEQDQRGLKMFHIASDGTDYADDNAPTIVQMFDALCTDSDKVPDALSTSCRRLDSSGSAADLLGESAGLNDEARWASDMDEACRSGDGTIETVSVKLNGKIQCPDCNQKFDTAPVLTLHRKFIHGARASIFTIGGTSDDSEPEEWD